LQHAREQVIGVKADLGASRVKEKTWRTIFHEILTPNPEEGYIVPSVDDIKDEAYGILAAAADTTGNGMAVAAYHVVKNPAIYKKLIAELQMLCSSLAYCEAYVAIAALFHRFDNLKGNELSAPDLVYDDYFVSHHPMDAVKFYVFQG
jgi:cytochrome P450